MRLFKVKKYGEPKLVSANTSTLTYVDPASNTPALQLKFKDGREAKYIVLMEIEDAKNLAARLNQFVEQFEGVAS